MTRGLTLIELLLALALLAAIVSAVAAWTQISGQLVGPATESARKEAAARAVLELIHDDLTCGELATSNEQTRSDRIQVVDDVLHIQTRNAGVGGIVRQYRLDDYSRALRIIDHSSASAGDRERLLLDDLQSFECNVNDDHAFLTVTIVLDTDSALTRRYRLP